MHVLITKTFLLNTREEKKNFWNTYEHKSIIIQEDEIIRVFNKISTKKATGPDKISVLVLKKCSLLYIVHNIFQTSISVFKMPTLWKTGDIIPASKKTIAKVNNDLRQITLTAILSKCLERVVLPNVLCYVKHALITSNLPT